MVAMLQLPAELAQLGGYIAISLLVLGVVVRCCFAAAIFEDARRLAENGQRTLFVNGIIWSFAVLVGGLLAVLVYWLLHHSHLAKQLPMIGETETFNLDDYRQQ